MFNVERRLNTKPGIYLGDLLCFTLVFIFGICAKHINTLLKDSDVSLLLRYLAYEEKTTLLREFLPPLLLSILGFAVHLQLLRSLHCWVVKSNLSLLLVLSFDLT